MNADRFRDVFYLYMSLIVNLFNRRREILSNVIQCLKMLLEEKRMEVDHSLANTAARLKLLEPDDAGSQAKLWEYRDNILALWEDPAIQVIFRLLE